MEISKLMEATSSSFDLVIEIKIAFFSFKSTVIIFRDDHFLIPN